MLVAYPTGRVAPGLERRLVRLGWFVAVTPVLAVLLAENPDQTCDDCPENKLLVRDSPQVLDALTVVAGVMIVVLLAGVALVLVRRWRVFGPGAAHGARAGAVDGRGHRRCRRRRHRRGRLARHGSRAALEAALLVLIAAVPFAFLLGLLRSRLSRAGAVSALVERFGGTSVRDALAEALGDPDALARLLAAGSGPLRRRGRTAVRAPGRRRRAGGDRDRARGCEAGGHRARPGAV